MTRKIKTKIKTKVLDEILWKDENIKQQKGDGKKSSHKRRWMMDKNQQTKINLMIEKKKSKMSN